VIDYLNFDECISAVQAMGKLAELDKSFWGFLEGLGVVGCKRT
jgi:hypothetical protein